MTIQKRLDCVLKHRFRAERQDAGVKLAAQGIILLMENCGFKEVHEKAFYIRALYTENLLDSDCSKYNTILQAIIAMDGYRHLDTLQVI